MKKTTLFCCAFVALLMSGFAFPVSAQLVLNSYNNQTVISDSVSVRLTPGFYAPAGSSLRIFIDKVPRVNFAGLPSADQNYVSTRIFKVPGVSATNLDTVRSVADVNQTVQYFDGLGRSLQLIQTQASPGFKDLVQPVVYDAFGREALKYLPYAAQTGLNGNYRSSGTADDIGFYSSPVTGVKATAFPYAESVFEASPLNRVIAQGAPGAAWQVSQGHTVKTGYSVNVAYEVRLWTVTGNGATGTSFYAAGTLYKTVIQNENILATAKAGSVEEFKDLEGKVLLRRNWETEVKSLDTYYVYDDLENLRYVLPPAVNKNGFSEVTSFDETQAVFTSYIYGYHYDGRKRIVEKKIPGKDGWVYFVYNKLDQLVLSQDPNQASRSPKEWSFSKYDAFGRVVITGVYRDSGTRTSLQAVVDAQTVNLWEIAQNTGYSNTSFPTNNKDNNHINYYDNYNFPGSGNYTFTGGSTKTNTLLTGSVTRVLSSTDSLLTVNYYDDRARLIKVFSQHYLGGVLKSGNYDETTNTYDFPGQVIESIRIHRANGNVTTIDNTLEYDHQGRLLNSYENINNQGKVLLSANLYNEIGQLQHKQLQNGLQSTDYAYNERGWLKSRTSNQFSESLNYEDGSTPQWNGNITNQYWGSGATSGLTNVFTYSYDQLNRLTQGSSTGVQMSESLGYDVMGNISQLSRDGAAAGTYNYTGNRLSSVSGGSLATGNYVYDANGNVITDGRNGVAITYNLLDLPQTVTKSGLSLSYVYDADGKKLRKISSTEGTTDYIGGIQYKGGVIDFIQTTEGLARNNQGNYSYEYNLQDHLGNVRYSFNQHPVTGAVQKLQEDSYYPFGLRKVVQAGTNQYLYNGKELQNELGQYDYGARFYDPVVARWNVVDPLAEKSRRFSPYVYGNNNPIRFIDVDGMFAVEPTPEEAARIAAHVYGDQKDNILIGGWRVSSKAQKLEYINKDNGLLSALYERKISSGNHKGEVEYVYATAGTNDKKGDIVADLSQPLGTSDQYGLAAINAIELKKLLGSAELTFTGHSLGGGEAALNAYATGKNAITFNPAGLSDETIKTYAGGKNPSTNIDAYIMRTDPLNYLQYTTPLPNANGTVHEISSWSNTALFNGHSIMNFFYPFSK